MKSASCEGCLLLTLLVQLHKSHSLGHPPLPSLHLSATVINRVMNEASVKISDLHSLQNVEVSEKTVQRSPQPNAPNASICCCNLSYECSQLLCNRMTLLVCKQPSSPHLPPKLYYLFPRHVLAIITAVHSFSRPQQSFRSVSSVQSATTKIPICV